MFIFRINLNLEIKRLKLISCYSLSFKHFEKFILNSYFSNMATSNYINKSNISSCQSEAVKYKLCESPGKGMGIFANRDIARGELIIAEKPLVTYCQTSENYMKATDELEKIFEKLTKTDQETFYSLHNSWPMLASKCLGIFKTNALPLGVDSPVGAIFPVISRINHSCLPNVNHYWNESKGMETIYAMKDIPANQEILTAYKDPFCDKTTRKALLMESFNFECKCEICSIEDKMKQKQSDIRRNLMKSLDSEIFEIAVFQPAKAMEKVYLMQKLMTDECVDYDANKMGKNLKFFNYLNKEHNQINFKR